MAKCVECGSGDVEFFKIVDGTEIYRCNQCGEEYAKED